MSMCRLLCVNVDCNLQACHYLPFFLNLVVLPKLFSFPFNTCIYAFVLFVLVNFSCTSQNGFNVSLCHLILVVKKQDISLLHPETITIDHQITYEVFTDQPSPHSDKYRMTFGCPGKAYIPSA